MFVRYRACNFNEMVDELKKLKYFDYFIKGLMLMNLISNSNNNYTHSSYKLDLRGANKLAFEIHKNLMAPGFVDTIMENFGLELLVATKNSGLVSNILNYFVETSNTLMIDSLENKVALIDDFKLMKRDYLNLCKYFYHQDYPRSQKYFTTDILGVKTDTNTSVLQQKDINFILSNKLYKLLGFLSGLFISSEYIDGNNLVIASGQFRKFTIKSVLAAYLTTQIESHMGSFITIANNFYTKQMGSARVIIDAGNVLHARNGKVTQETIGDLINVIEQTRKTIGEPVIVIHKRHGKLYPHLLDLINKTNVKYFQTPYNFNDDIFIMWFFVKSFGTLCILSNDKYRDHIFAYQSSRKSDMFFISEFSNILTEQTLSYQLAPLQIQSPLTYSNCIQVINSYVYIPHVSDQFIQIPFE